MNILVDLLPIKIKVEDTEYPINTDFRSSILFELLMQDTEIENDKKTELALDLYYPTIPQNIDKAIEQLLWFYRCGKEIQEAKGYSNKSKDLIYSFDFDDMYIYSAFLDQYHIDLQDIEYLHWWKFKAMFYALKDDSTISKIMGYRSVEITNDMSNEQKKFYRQMKEIYKIPVSKSEDQRLNAIEYALLNGGNLTGILG